MALYLNVGERSIAKNYHPVNLHSLVCKVVVKNL